MQSKSQSKKKIIVKNLNNYNSTYHVKTQLLKKRF